jgi:hypothetical protein
MPSLNEQLLTLKMLNDQATKLVSGLDPKGTNPGLDALRNVVKQQEAQIEQLLENDKSADAEYTEMREGDEGNKDVK